MAVVSNVIWEYNHIDRFDQTWNELNNQNDNKYDIQHQQGHRQQTISLSLIAHI